MTDIQSIVVVSMAVAALSMTVTRAVLFRRLRTWVSGESEFFGELFSCPYCFSHWVATAGILTYHPNVINCGNIVVDLLVTTLATVTLSSLFCGLIFWAFKHDTVEE